MFILMLTLFLQQELNREESAGLGGPSAEKYVLDFRGAIIERRAVVAGERLSLSHCLVLSILILRMSKECITCFFC